ncbi:MAG TPA: serine/threonine-protein kinase [Kofleriaceae bacterium]|jgi:serine/threonine-protein kinase
MLDDEDTKTSSSRLPVSTQTTITSPIEALELDELQRTRRFCFIALPIAMLGGLSAPLLPGDTTATILLISSVAVAVFAILFLLSRTRNPETFRRPSTALGWFIPAACVTTAIPYFGAFSPAPLVLVLGVYFVGLGRSAGIATAVYATCAGMQGLVAALVIAGAHDTGLVHVEGLARRDEIIIQLLVQLVLAATFVTARMSRRTALLAVGELERAVRIAARREALLLEAHEELERALRSGRGRFSEQKIATYNLGKLLGRGAMGEVYEATGAQGVVAVKMLSQASLGNPTHVLRFLRELRTAAAIESPHVVKVLEVGEVPVPYLVMERLVGSTLSDVLRSKRGLTTHEVVEMIRQVGEGVTAAAAANVVHRDLKPQNVFRDHGTWKILDFGIARAIDSGDTLTQGHIVGTPSYMAPEQAAGGFVDHRADLYALAAIAYRALTGQPPYAAGEVAETLYRVVHTLPHRPTDLAPQLPTEVDLVLAIGLAKDPDLRFQSAGEFATALAAAFGPGLPLPVRERGAALVRAGVWRSR